MWLSSETEELTTPRSDVSLYAQSMRPPSVSLAYNIQSQTKAPFISELLLRQLILNNEPQGESGDHKAHTSFHPLKPEWVWSLSLFFSVGLVCIRITLSTTMASFSMYVFTIKEKRLVMRKTAGQLRDKCRPSLQTCFVLLKQSVATWTYGEHEWVQVHHLTTSYQSKTCPNTPVFLMNHLLHKVETAGSLGCVSQQHPKSWWSYNQLKFMML